VSFLIKQNDRYPSLQAVIADDQGNPVDLSGASLMFAFAKMPACDAPDGTLPTLMFKNAAVIVTPAAGLVRYDWADGDTASAGNFVGEFEVDIAGKKWSAPTTGYIPVTINPELG
jgi:hypothetical protein